MFGCNYCFHVHEIDVYLQRKPEYDDSLELLCGFIRKQLRRATMEKFEVERESSQLLPVSVPFVFGTPAGTAVDLRLFSRDIIRKALPTLVTILERETRGWFLHFRERLISELRAQKKTDEEIEQASIYFIFYKGRQGKGRKGNGMRF